MAVLAWTIYAIFCLWVIGAVFHIRRVTWTGEGAAAGYINGVALCGVSAVLLPVLGASPFHILWLAPASILIGGLSQSGFPPLTPILGRPMVALACLGLDRGLIARRRQQWKEAQLTAIDQGIALDEAIRDRVERGEWQ